MQSVFFRDQVPYVCGTFIFVPARLGISCVLDANESVPWQSEIEFDVTVAATAANGIFTDQLAAVGLL